MGAAPAETPAGPQRRPLQDQAEGIEEEGDEVDQEDVREREMWEPCDSNRGIELEEKEQTDRQTPATDRPVPVLVNN